MDDFYQLLALLSPFLAAILTYYFVIKGKRKDVDIEKEKELNTVLSNLLVVWHYLTRVESVIDIINGDKEKRIFPVEMIPVLLFKSELLNDNCFINLDKSVDILKKYDPILHFEIEGIGKVGDMIKNDYLLPFLESEDLNPEGMKYTISPLLNQTLKEVENYLRVVSGLINRKTKRATLNFIDSYLDEHPDNVLDSFNQNYYQLTTSIIPEGEEIPSFEEFTEFAKSDEFKSLMELQMKALASGSAIEITNVITENPDLSFDELTQKVNERLKNS